MSHVRESMAGARQLWRPDRGQQSSGSQSRGARTAKHRIVLAVGLLYALGTIASAAPAAYAEPTADPIVPTVTTTVPTVTLTGELIQLADQTSTRIAAVQTTGGELVPVSAAAVTSLKSGSTVTVDVAVPAPVRSVAAANKTLTVREPDGTVSSTPLDSRDLAAASDGTPEPAKSDLGQATMASAASTGQPLAVSAVVATPEPVGSYEPEARTLFVARVQPSGWSAENTVSDVQIGAQVTGASSYWSTVSREGVTLNIANITAPYRSIYNCTNPLGMFQEAKTKTGFTNAPNTSLVVVLPADISSDVSSGCSYGLGTVGTSVNDDGMLYVSDDAFPVLAHELGHNMSLKHADTLECPTASDSAHIEVSHPTSIESIWTGSGCREAPYGDGQDVMSASPPSFTPFLSSPQSLRTGLIPAEAATEVSAVGTTEQTLTALGGGSGVRVAKVLDPSNNVTYFVEYRVVALPDTGNVYGDTAGVRVLRFNPTTGTTVLLDPTPSSTPSSDTDATLGAGATFRSYSGWVRVKTLSTSPTSATVAITIESPTVPAAPTGVRATTGNAQAAVSWTAPASDGGSAISGYTVTAAPGGRTASTTGARTATVTGLTNGTSYSFTVKATNGIGSSPMSAASAAVTGPVMSFSGDAKADVLAVKSGVLYLYRGNGRGGFTGAGTKLSTGSGTFTQVISPGDFSGDGKADVMAVKSGVLYLYRGNGAGGFTGARVRLATGWSTFTKVFSPGDFNGDRKADVLAVKSGVLYLYRGNGHGGFTGARVTLGTGWSTFTKVFSPGDFNGDGKADVLAVKSGVLYLFRGNGAGGFSGAKVRLGTGWSTFTKVTSSGDFNGDRKADVLTIKSGVLYLYRGNGRGGFTGAKVRVGTGWGSFTHLS